MGGSSALKRVVIYGDSIMKGTIIDEARRYHATVDAYLGRLAERFGFVAENRARFGMTVTRGRAIVEKDAASGLEADYAVIEFGGNDCDFKWDEISADPEAYHEPATPPAVFASTLRSIIATLRSSGAAPILATLPPIDSERYLSFITRRGNDRSRILSWLGDVEQISRFQKGYSDAVAAVAREAGCFLVDIRAAFHAAGDFRRLICLDGIHPNPDGYAVIERAFASFAAAL